MKRENDQPLDDAVLHAIRTVSQNQQKMLAELTSHRKQLLTVNTNLTNLTMLIQGRAQQLAEGRFLREDVEAGTVTICNQVHNLQMPKPTYLAIRFLCLGMILCTSCWPIFIQKENLHARVRGEEQ